MKPKISLAEAQRLADSGLNGPAIARALGVSRKRIAYLIKIGTLRCAVGTWGGADRFKSKKLGATPVCLCVDRGNPLPLNADTEKLNGPQQVVEHPRGPDHRQSVEGDRTHG